ncbi:hypothetical protein TNIN_198771 [Trichonephila inaurata madagascariensis]|uniref:Uncharacterized protein n=1 Tax=Trichonephila inaurata madagascariensis TaxID=2747483 RepID=A0A8X6YUA0_9ARAC|nr:hypothetical protein TNIN_198771 [Trichonephila inaurata madagascariensis]
MEIILTGEKPTCQRSRWSPFIEKSKVEKQIDEEIIRELFTCHLSRHLLWKKKKDGLSIDYRKLSKKVNKDSSAGTTGHNPTVDVRSNPQMALIVTGRKVSGRKVKVWMCQEADV